VILSVVPGCETEISTALAQHGDNVRGAHRSISAIDADVHASDLVELANHPCVTAVSDDAPVEVTGVKRSNWRSVQFLSAGSKRVAATSTLRDTLGLEHTALFGSAAGSGVGVAIIDSGIAPSDDFAGRITAFYDFTKGGVLTTPYDDYGHGTHIAGLIGSSGRLSNYEFQGVAPDVRFVVLKVLDGTGQGKTSDVISALEFVTANKALLNVQIVNLSLGHEIFAPAAADPLVQAVERASAAGLIVVTSAGNFGQTRRVGVSGYTGITSPGNAPSAITVSAAVTMNTTTRDDDGVASYSSRGPSWYDAYAKPNVIAPGDKLLSDASPTSYLYKKLIGNQAKAKRGQPLLQLSGTSMAAAVTTGVVALIVQQHNEAGLRHRECLSPNLAKAILEFSAVPIAGADWLTQGTGEINARGAMALASAIETRTPAGRWWLRSGVTPASTIDGKTYSWSQKVIWGNDVLTGDLLYVSSAAWRASDNIVWGTDDNIVWGTSAMMYDDNIVWGTSAVWATNLVWQDRLIGLMFDDNIVWGTHANWDHIVWGTLDFDNIVWGTMLDDNIVWGTWDGDNIVWGTLDGLDNIVWGTGVLGGEDK
jgi:serine protease AprX